MDLTKSETELVALFLEGHQHAFEQVYDTYAPMLLGSISRIVPDKYLASRVFRQSFVYIWQNRSAYDPAKERLFTWMNKCAFEIAVDLAVRMEQDEQLPQQKNQASGFGASKDHYNNVR